jgi:hypothetical protein
MRFPFIGPAYKVRATTLAAEQCINLYPELGNGTSKNVMCLLGTPGKRLWLNFPGGAVRGMMRVNAANALVVSTTTSTASPTLGVSTLLGTITAGTTPVCMASNGATVMIAAGATGYYVNIAGWTLSQIVDPDFLGADFVGYLDGYFVFNQPGTQKFQITNLLSTNIDPLDFASAEGAPDLLLSLLIDHREVWLFGETSTEVFWNSGNSEFPIERINGAFMEHGIAAKYSAAKMDNTVYWLGYDDNGQGIVVRATGYDPQRCSDHGVEYAISQMSRIDDAVAYTYQQEGHFFYVLTFPTAQQTWVLDSTTGLWHQRAHRNTSTADYERDRAMSRMNFAGKVLVGDHANGNVYQLDLNYFTDNGDPLPRVRTTAYLSDQDYRDQFFQWFQLDMEAGIGLAGADGDYGVDPQVVLQWSDDGGQTWSNEHTASAGRIGERKTRVRWRRLGRSRARIFRVIITDPVKVAMVSAGVGVVVGNK